MKLVGSVTLSVYLRIARRIVFWTLMTVLSSVALWHAYCQLSKSQPSADAPAWAYDTDQPAAGAADGRQVADVLRRSIDAWNRDDKRGFCEAFLASPSLTMTYHYPDGGRNNDLNTVDMIGWHSLLQLVSEYTDDRAADMGKVTIKRMKIRILSPGVAYAVSSWRVDVPFLHTDATDCSVLILTDAGWKIAADTSTFLEPIAQAGSATGQ